MEVEYELTTEDLIAFQRYHQQNPPSPQQRGGPATALVGGFVFLMFVTAGLFFFLSDNPTASWYILMVPFVVLGAAAMLLGLIVYARLTAPRQLSRAMQQGRNAEKFLGWRRLSIDAEAIRNTSEFASATYLWHGIDKVGATLDHAFFYINTTTAVIVPCRAFRDDRLFKDFVDAARHYHRMGEVAGETAAGRGAWGLPRSSGNEAPRDSDRAPDDRIIRDNRDRL
jgi:hypothetical protein